MASFHEENTSNTSKYQTSLAPNCANVNGKAEKSNLSAKKGLTCALSRYIFNEEQVFRAG
jgi:hypothetical protein